MRKNRAYYRVFPLPSGGNGIREAFSLTSEGSPRVNGKLSLRSNPFSMSRHLNIAFTQSGNDPNWMGDWPVAPTIGGPGGSNTSQAQKAYRAAYSKAYASLRSKLYKGNANLGVTLGSYKQSADMIRNRYRQLINLNEQYYRLFNRSLAIRRGDTQSIASAHLEFIFGWQPLAQDIWAAANTVIQLADERKAVSGRGSEYFEWKASRSSSDPKYNSHTESGLCRVTVGTLVTIVNPNRWLLERAGLLNPASVAWDLVPWSFLVNMVTNMGQLVNSITDFAGLSFDNQSTTYTFDISGAARVANLYPTNHPGYGTSSSVYVLKDKGRTIGTIPRPSFQFKMPRAEWETAAMLASLFTQRFRSLNRLLSV